MNRQNLTTCRLAVLVAAGLLAVACGGGGGGGGSNDTDGDGVVNTSDNCPTISNLAQTDTDSDGSGDACDADDDNDGVADTTDNCPLLSNVTQTDNDNDAIGDACDADDDNDNVGDGADNCPLIANTNQLDTDADNAGDVCDDDDDGDGVDDLADNCPLVANLDQTDTDGDGFGDACDPDTNIAVSGTVTFDRVPHNPATNGLDYGSITSNPVRNAVVELITGGSVIATVETDSLGNYTVQAPINSDVIVRVRVETVRVGLPGWNVRVVDNTQMDALYVLQSASFNTGVADVVQDLHASSGWDGSSYAAERKAGPFAALDAITDSIQNLLLVDPDAQFPDLVLKWSPDNRAVSGDESIGEIGNTFFRRDGTTREILLLGNEDTDTDEYDRHVVIHEWGHYFEDVFSRADTIGGGHSSGDRLDPRVAYSEGWGYTYAGITTGDPVTRDALGIGQASGFQIDVEDNSNLNPGWFSEGSVQSIIYDLIDATDDGVDTVSLGFGPVYDLLSGDLANSVPPITIFSFVALFKQQNPGETAVIDAIVSGQGIDSIGIDEFATGETHDEGRGSDVLPVYGAVTVDGGATTVCTLAGEGPGDFGTFNKLSVRRFLRLDIATAGNYRFTATGVVDGDPDIVLHSGGFLTAFELIGPTETGDIFLSAGSFVVEVYEFSNLTDTPLGNTCINLSVQSL
ncbi:MAG: thrombospondin type 3 repeat-containing protein [Gammaproteobacteria bacterium]|nr:thrombospondin type 3 repeat-containing protein [Gammaproteobacteria bacterium]